MNGYRTKISIITILALFSTLTGFSQGNPGLDDEVYDMDFGSNGEIYVAGLFKKAGAVDVAAVAMWNEEKWTDMGGGVHQGNWGPSPSRAYAVCVDGTNVYVGGEFRYVGKDFVRAERIAKWDGTAWSPLGSGVQIEQGSVKSIAVLGGKIYLTGDFALLNKSKEVVEFAAIWDGGDYKQLGSINDAYTYLGASARLFTNDNKLYAIGSNIHRLLQWTGTTWTVYEPFADNINDAYFEGAILYVGGYFQSIPIPDPNFPGDYTSVDAKNIASWQGEEWVGFGDGIGEVERIAFLGSSLVVAGSGVQIGNGPRQHVAKWTGSQWIAMGGFQQTNVSDSVFVRGLKVFKGTLYAAGRFENANGILVGHIAQWHGSKWGPLGPAEGEPVFKVDNDGVVTALGKFITTGADFAELFPVAPSAPDLQPGDVLALTETGGVTKIDETNAQHLIGVYATNPGMLAGGNSLDKVDSNSSDKEGPQKIPVAMMGIVPVNASANQGAIKPGDLLQLADEPGCIALAKPISLGGREFYPEEIIIGKALQGLAEGKGLIRIRLTKR